jgi:cytochrome P450
VSDLTLDREQLRRLYDLRSPVYESRGNSFVDDPYPTFHRLRESGPVHRGTPHEALGWTGEVDFVGLPYPLRPHFSAYDHATVTEVLKDDARFVTNVPPLAGETPLPDVGILFMDGKRHRSYRTLVQPSFVPNRAMWWLDNWIKSTVHALIDGFEHDGRVDLSPEFCGPIPMLTITGGFGFGIGEALAVRAAVTAGRDANRELAGLLMPVIAARREVPRDDLISVLVQAEMTDEDGTLHRLSDIEVLAFALLILAAGSGTTWKQMGTTLTALLDHPEALAATREDPSLLRAVVEESLRWQPTDPVFSRFVATDTVLGGVELPAGAIVHACLGAANRDPKRWERPDEFDPFRPMRPHVGFGHGPHTCLGMHVARAEMTHGIAALLERLPNLRLDPDAPPPRFIGIYERGPDSVPVQWDPQS